MEVDWRGVCDGTLSLLSFSLSLPIVICLSVCLSVTFFSFPAVRGAGQRTAFVGCLTAHWGLISGELGLRVGLSGWLSGWLYVRMYVGRMHELGFESFLMSGM